MFLQQEIKDNEHELVGTISEKRKTRKGVIERLEEMDKTIVPDGTIKQISTASNKSHKQALLEQLKKIPGRNTDSIMDGETMNPLLPLFTTLLSNKLFSHSILYSLEPQSSKVLVSKTSP